MYINPLTGMTLKRNTKEGVFRLFNQRYRMDGESVSDAYGCQKGEAYYVKLDDGNAMKVYVAVREAPRGEESYIHHVVEKNV